MRSKYKIGDVVDLDDVMISPFALYAWQVRAEIGARALVVQGVDTKSIPDEQGSWLATGELEIFVEVVGTRISMKIPPGQWAWDRSSRV